MKVLTLFFDMLRPEFIFDSNLGFTFKAFLNEIGGDVYDNCYTPAPDTTRSIASFWTGKIPSKNNCNVREKWPKYFIDINDNLLNSLYRNNVDVNIFHDPSEVDVGILPENAKQIDIHQNYNLDEFTNSCKLSNNSFTFIGIQDFHISFNAYGYDILGIKKSFLDLNKTLEILKDFINHYSFDHILIFSDHGFITDSERSNEANYISKKRNQILLFQSNNKKGLTFNNKFCSIMCIRPTIEYYFDISSNCDDYHLFSQKNINCIYIEDHHCYQPSLNHNFNYWGLINSDGTIFSATLENCFLNMVKLCFNDPIIQSLLNDLHDNTSFKFYREYSLAVKRHKNWLKTTNDRKKIILSNGIHPKCSIIFKIFRYLKNQL